ncbi:vegetative incompatibility protein HET-E-1 [Colletotrichum asianum]|uniref:Vegetative incompatibility protein HET-E-1 n=1 Tax=Colletotrichum asianum TaxID=702518 RepID=A0A8H3VXG5_9PEZI|nr:vegetative incompatibility protein HET-E-1 [Colletotrichum asianum]
MLVGHSMGGCVAKKAYILARQDPMCKDLVERVHSMFFLGTPHRGSDLASILENIITVAWGKKPFVRDLTPNSATLTEINDSFRHYAPELRLWSFYETLPVKAKVLNKIVVDKLSSTLGYPNEEIAAMNADHRHVCKFENEADPNYKTLRNAIHTAVDMVRESLGKFRKLSMVSDNTLISADAPSSTPAEVVSKLRSYLGVQSTLEDDLVTLQVLKEPGSCEWLATRNCFASWEERKGPQLLWLTGRPAAGKSVLSSHVIDRLRSRNIHCSYFFFKHAKSGKSTLSDCFLSLAFQMATQDTAVREKLLELQDDEAVWDRADEASVWRKLFVGGIFKVQSASQHYWVIDGVDECVNFNTLFTKKLLATMPSQLRVFATSRDLEEVGRGLISLGSRANLHTMVDSDTIGDMRLFLITKLMELDRLDNDKEREAMCERILEKSSGSFLWVRLVLQEFENAWTEEAMRAVLEEVPADLHAVYHRILQSIETDSRKQMLSKSILAWVCLAPRPLTTDELRCAVKIDISQTLQSMGKAIPNLCGQLVFVDKADKVQIIHETAREFLLSPGLDSALAIPKAKTHTRLSSLLLSYLSGDVLKPRQVKSQGKHRGFLKAASKSPPDTALLSYALAFFSDHIYRCNSEDDDLMEDLCTFFKSYNVLSWIENIAQTGDLGDITRTAINLRGYLGRRAKYVAPTDRQIQLVDDWVMDLIRVAAKFSRQLLACPSSIHCLIPPLCPPGSIIAKTFAKEIRSSPLVVKNIPDGTWDDCLIRIDYQKGQTTAVSHGDRYFAIGLSTGQLSIYDRTSIQRIHNLKQPERIRVLEFSRDDEHLVSCGNKQLVVWNPKSGATVLSSQVSSPILAITFIGGSEMLSVSQSSELTKWYYADG